MSVATALSAEDALRFTRSVESERVMIGVRMLPMAGNTLVELGCLAEVRDFLVIVTPEEAAQLSMRQRINYLDFRVLASWVREVIGDADLADALEEVIATDTVFGRLAPDIRRVLDGRLEEYREALGGSEPDVE